MLAYIYYFFILVFFISAIYVLYLTFKYEDELIIKGSQAPDDEKWIAIKRIYLDRFLDITYVQKNN